MADVAAIAERALAAAGAKPASEGLRRELQALDRTGKFTPEALRHFQCLLGRLGVATHRKIELPLDDQPFWHRVPHPLANFQSTPQLPPLADVVIIGAGLTGAAAAYRLRSSGLKVVLLDQGDPACEASGRNGGNFELLPENSVGIYEGLAPGRLAFMKRRYPWVPIEVLHAVSERQASLVLGLALRNRDIMKETILNEAIACDFSPRGWLHLAASEKEEQGLCDEVSLAAQQGQRIEIWSRSKIKAEFGIDAAFLGRFIPGDGTYHPFKFVCGEIAAALRGNVSLYTRTPVRRITSSHPDRHKVMTGRGTIQCRRVIVATNAFTRDLLPQLSAIVPHQSQILVTEHVVDRARGRIVTSDTGPIFFNQPRDGARDGRAPLLMGGGDDRPIADPGSRRRSPEIHKQLLHLRDSFYPELAGQPPSAEWNGPMAFTPDGLPCIGYLRPGVIIAAGYNGYGGTYATAAGAIAADIAFTGSVPDHVAEEIFSPRRLLRKDPLFLTERRGLWQVASSLCQQLRSVNGQISEALTLQRTVPAAPAPALKAIVQPPGRSAPAAAIDPLTVAAFSSFAKFSRGEIRTLLRATRRWDIARDTVVFTEGSPGGSCYVVLEGAIDVSINSRGQHQLLATLEAGSVFGQVSVIDDVPRSATCSARTDAVLLEIEREACKRLLRGGSRTAIKLLATLNEGLISALRGADLRLLQIDKPNQALG